MASLDDFSQPRLAAGCRWGGSEEDRVILFPEGAIRASGHGTPGPGTLRRPADFWPDHRGTAGPVHRRGPAKIRDDIGKFLEQLQNKRIVDY